MVQDPYIGHTILRNTGNYLPVYKVYHPRRLEPSGFILYLQAKSFTQQMSEMVKLLVKVKYFLSFEEYEVTYF